MNIIRVSCRGMDASGRFRPLSAAKRCAYPEAHEAFRRGPKRIRRDLAKGIWRNHIARKSEGTRFSAFGIICASQQAPAMGAVGVL